MASALNVELRDIVAQLNPSGRDVNGDRLANNDDLAWTHTYMVGGQPGLLPASAPRLSISSATTRAAGVGVPSPKKKVTLYFSAAMLEETQREAIRQDRSISWIIQAAWRIAREEVRRLPGYGTQDARRAEPTDPTVSVSKRQIDSL